MQLKINIYYLIQGEVVRVWTDTDVEYGTFTVVDNDEFEKIRTNEFFVLHNSEN